MEICAKNAGETLSEGSARALFDTLRGALRGTDPAGEVPPDAAGYLLSDPGGPTESDGRRPLGQLRNDLRHHLARVATIADEERWVVAAFYGIEGFPADLERGGALVGVVPRQRVGESAAKAKRAAGRSTISQYRRRGIRAVAELMHARSTAGPIIRKAVPDPDGAPWFARLLATCPDRGMARRALLTLAVLAARDLASTAGSRELRLQTALDWYAYGHGLLSHKPALSMPMRTDTAAAVAAVSVSLWEITDHGSRALVLRGPATTRLARPSSIPGQYQGRGWIVEVPAQAAALASGKISAASVDAGATAALALFRTGADARALCDLCLWGLRRLGGDADQGLVARVLMISGRASRRDQTWRPVVFADQIYKRAGPCLLWFHASQDAAMSAAEVGENAYAHTILADQTRQYHQVKPCSNLDPDVDRVEFGQQIALIASGIYRSQAEATLFPRPRDTQLAARHILKGLHAADNSIRLLSELPYGWDGYGPGENRHRGDATGSWRVNPLVRRGELLVLQCILALADPRTGPSKPLPLLDEAHYLACKAMAFALAGPGSPAEARLDQADGAVSETIADGEETRFAIAEPTKLRLAIALAGNDPDAAVRSLATLQQLGAPMDRWGAGLIAALAGFYKNDAASAVVDLVRTRESTGEASARSQTGRS